MEIPYEVKARPDTGLWNAKIGIWLFLASEVMLFGGLFSGYVFLRLGVTDGLDNPWPERQLIVWPGFLNTLVLIASSLFVVLAWSHLKMRNYKKYQFWMFLVVLCALTFMGLKAYEYYGKFTHYGMKLEDNSVVEGILLKDRIEFEAAEVTVNVAGDRIEFLEDMDGEGRFRTPGGEEVTISKAWIREMNKAYRDAEEKEPGSGVGSITLKAVEPVKFSFRPKKVSGYSATEVTYRDAAKFTGTLGDDKIYFEVHEIDMRMTDDLEHSMLWKYVDEHEKEEFFHHREEKEAELKEMGVEHPRPDETHVLHLHPEDHHYPEIVVERADKKFLSNHGPAYNTYYAIYFTMTGLHGLHVVLGALVLAYFLCFQRKLYEKNPEHLANRVEVGGLFWHFVDLVWIFLFPVMYLM